MVLPMTARITPTAPSRAAALTSHLWSNTGVWHEDADCASPEYDPDWWHDTHPGGADVNSLRAKLVCASCPIREICLSEAPKAEDSGIWGGLTAKERQRWRNGHGVILPPDTFEGDVIFLAYAVRQVVLEGATTRDVETTLGKTPEVFNGRPIFEQLSALTWRVSHGDESVGGEVYGGDTAEQPAV